MVVRVGSDLLLLLDLLHENGLLLVLAALVLEPDADDARTEARHFDQLLLHEGVGTRIGRVARPERVQLFLIEDGADAGRFAVRTAAAVAAAAAAAAVAAVAAVAAAARGRALFAAARPFAAFLPRRRDARVGTICEDANATHAR